MRTFGEHLSEAFGQKKTYEFIFSGGAASSYTLIPISNNMIKRIIGEVPKITAYHNTGADGVLGVLKMQGKKKTLSTFTRPSTKGDTFFLYGVASGGGFTVELEGYPLITADADLQSAVDEQGRKWIQLDTLAAKSKSIIVLRKSLDNIQKKITEFVNKEAKFPVDEMLNWRQIRYLADSKEKRLKQLFGRAIAMYFDEMEIFVKKNMTLFRKCLDASNVPGPLNPGGLSWNEVLLNNFKVTAIYAVDPKEHDISDDYEEQHKNINTIRERYPSLKVQSIDKIRTIIRKKVAKNKLCS